MDRPKLRKVERIALQRDGAALLVLRDPLAIAEPLAIDADFGPVLDLLDGTRTPRQIRQSLLFGPGLDVETDAITTFAAELGAAGWLDDDAFRERWADLHDDFLATDPRASTLAGLLYPEDPAELRAALAHALPLAPWSLPWGVLVPHGPLELVSGVLAATLGRIEEPAALDFVVVLATDHHPGLLPYALTDKAWATPLGTVPCERSVAAALRRRVPWIDREQIRHRTASALEWAVLYLQHVCNGRPPPIVPILCGATVCTSSGLDEHAAELVASLEALCEGARTLVWASAELGHVGPAYGRPMLADAELPAIAARDRGLVDALARGRVADLLAAADAVAAQGRPSGLPVLATLTELRPVGAKVDVRALELARVPGPEPGWAGLAGLRILDEANAGNR